MNTKIGEAYKMSKNAFGKYVYPTDLIAYINDHYLSNSVPISVTKRKCRVSMAVARLDDVPHEGHGWMPPTGVHRTVLCALGGTSGRKDVTVIDDFQGGGHLEKGGKKAQKVRRRKDEKKKREQKRTETKYGGRKEEKRKLKWSVREEER
jgi:hypothetical protein